ncbi:MAG: thioredoxin family protein [Lentimicrobiaceae bacterium]|nr:thioredoxin family protein [Lentimicrobiaceae bacterium]
MKKLIQNIFLSALFFFLGFTLVAQTEKKPELLTKETFLKRVWNYEASPNEFKYLGDKPCMIDLYADWCGYCRRIAPFMEEFSKTYQGQIYVYKVNTDHYKELLSLFQAKGLPTVIFVPMKGQPTAIRGAVAKDKYEQYIKEILLAK